MSDDTKCMDLSEDVMEQKEGEGEEKKDESVTMLIDQIALKLSRSTPDQVVAILAEYDLTLDDWISLFRHSYQRT